MTRKQKRVAPLRMERLEAKQMLAGDVVVSLVAGSLVIEGDDLANQVAITSGETAGSYVITGLDGTAVRLAGSEASEAGSVTVEGVRRDVRIGLGAGDDVVRLDDATFRNSVLVRTGEGNDRVVVGGGAAEDAELPTAEEASVRVGGGLIIETGAGDDVVNVASAAIRGHLSIGAGEGDDTVRLGGRVVEFDSESGETTEEATQPAILRVGSGIGVRLGDGADTLVASRASAAAVRVGGGLGADSVRLNQLRTGALTVAGGEDDASDEVLLSGVNARFAEVHTGAGADRVRIVDSAFGQLFASLGEGDDTLAMSGSEALAALLNGGAGEADAFRDAGDNRIRRKLVRGFERPAEEPAETAV